MGLINKTTVYINPTTTTRFNPDGKDDKARFNYDGTDARQTIFGFLPSLKFVPWYEGIRDTSSKATQARARAVTT